MKTVELNITSRNFESAEEVRTWLQALTGRGWVCTVEEVSFVEDFKQVVGIPLQADIAINENESVTLRFTNGVWRTWWFSEVPGEKYRVKDEERIDKNNKTSIWRVYWGLEKSFEDIEVWQPYSARFLKRGGNDNA